MNDHEIAFRFQLSPAELHWLAGAFGLTRLPLPDDLLRYTPNSQREAELKKAIASLQSRGLISRASSSWQVDRLPAAVIKWFGQAANMLVLDIHVRAGTSRRAHVFTDGIPVKAGQLLGYQGTWSGKPHWPMWVHVHFVITSAASEGAFPKEWTADNVIDPTPYLNLALLSNETTQILKCGQP